MSLCDVSDKKEQSSEGCSLDQSEISTVKDSTHMQEPITI